MTTVLDVRSITREFAVPAGPMALDARRPHWFERLFPSRDKTPAYRVFRALDNVSFKVARGEVVGIIGRNGAGKSTLLRILSRLIPPTAGEADIDGAVGSLLEVGTGFHPDLSGRENVYLNGALLGLGRSRIDALYPEIVAFAEIADFVDAPLKHYSSGMYLRLAFSVAAHLEADVLLLDEVLSVGDEWFARKCREKIRRMCDASRAVLVVGHNLQTLEEMCHRMILLDRGRVVMDGEPGRVIERYRQLGELSGGPAA